MNPKKNDALRGWLQKGVVALTALVPPRSPHWHVGAADGLSHQVSVLLLSPPIRVAATCTCPLFADSSLVGYSKRRGTYEKIATCAGTNFGMQVRRHSNHASPPSEKSAIHFCSAICFSP